MSKLGDDELSLILNWVNDRNDRKSFSEVCKHWLRVEGLARSSIRVFELDRLPHLLSRFPNLVTFETSEFITDTDLAILARKCPRIEVVNLPIKRPRLVDSDNFDGQSSYHDVGDEGLIALANGCPKLSKVSMRRRKNIGNAGVLSLLESAKCLTNLDFGWCSLVSDEALEAIGSANSITVLNLLGCSLITDRGLAWLSNGSSSKTIKKLVLAECDRITDCGVTLLQRMSGLEELNLAECGPKITDIGGVAIAAIQSLKRLNLSWLVNVSDPTLVALAENCPVLANLDVTGCELVTGAGVRAFAGHGCLEVFVLPSCYNVNVLDVEHLAVGCRSLQIIVLDKGLRIWVTTQIHDRIGRFCNLVWR
ncbi:hypothetical protein FEM48_Zijuj06G0091300 [Ziziphus jujuba var. spinosa]|uniref:COI1 F-box domain-containing protein n=1 Tax=Ziziphus jujuba var. spinosa TaxID=714518 RepID=A0A978V8E0_ZIZJJ|nr:hypothetical protein FEM48_Zijuj06G0091300 [Ziziphus jujuba var. spinosa]